MKDHNENQTDSKGKLARTEVEKIAERIMTRRVKRFKASIPGWEETAQDSFRAAQAFINVRNARRSQGGAA
jgi:hypothetical protein